jgi:hypothetical protein
MRPKGVLISRIVPEFVVVVDQVSMDQPQADLGKCSIVNVEAVEASIIPKPRQYV